MGTSVYIFVLVTVIILLPIMILASALRKGKAGICPQCGSQGRSKLKTRGSMALEIVLWLALIVPGLIYSIWRLTTKQEVCPNCSNPGMIPLSSPRGQQLQREYSAKPLA